MGFITFSQGASSPQPTPPTPSAIYAPDCGGATFTPHATTRAVYVDPDLGNDRYDGLYPDHTYGRNHGPKRTIYCAYRLLRTGYPDWLLLKRGGTWTDTGLNDPNTRNLWTKSGLDATNVMLIGWYGDSTLPWPDVSTTTSTQLLTNLASGVQYLATTGISFTSDFDAAGYDQSYVQQPYWTGATQQTNGWTVFTPTTGTSHDTKIVYCDFTGGDDSLSGLTPGQAKKHIFAAKALLRNGFPDWLLLKRGETWIESLASGLGGDDWQIGGFSATEPMLISTYGAMSLARPKLRTGDTAATRGAAGLRIVPSNSNPNPQAGSNMAVVGLEFVPYDRNGGANSPRGIDIEACLSTNLLIEDCKISNYRIALIAAGTGLNPGQRVTNLMIRRNIMVDSWSAIELYGGPGTGDGMLIGRTDGLLVEENIFDHNGWLDENDHSYYITSTSGKSNYYARNFYCQNLNTGVKIRGNVIAGTDGVQVRPGGNCDNNLFAKTGTAISFGAGNGEEHGSTPGGNPGGVGGTTKGNVIVHGRNLVPDLSLDPPMARGSGIDSGNTNGWNCSWNIIAHNHVDVDGASGRPINFGKRDSGNPNLVPYDVGCLDTHHTHNVVYDWEVGRTTTGWDGDCVLFESHQERIPDGHGGYIDVNVNPHVVGCTFTDNDVQLTSLHSGGGEQQLVRFRSLDPIAGNFVNARNRWFKTTGNPGQTLWRRMQPGDSFPTGRTMAEWKTDTGDSTSTWGLVATGDAAGQYPNPAADLPAYYATIAPMHGVAADGTIAPYLVACRLQQRGSWETALMPAYSIDDPSPGVGVYYPGVTYNGPLRYFRDGFALSHLGMTLTGCSPGTRAASGGARGVTLTGTGFLDYANTVPSMAATDIVRVYFNKVLATNLVVGSTSITCDAPSGTAGSLGSCLVEVDGGDGIVRSSTIFNYT